MFASPTSLSELAFQAEGGDAEAQYRLGIAFLLGEAHGHEVEQDMAAAGQWLARAAPAHDGARRLMEALCGGVEREGKPPASLLPGRGWRLRLPLLARSTGAFASRSCLAWWRASPRPARQAATLLAGLVAFALALLVWLAVLRSLPAALAALTAGAAVRLLGQKTRLRRLRNPQVAERVAVFHSCGARVHCDFEGPAVERYVAAWRWRAAAATAAAATCWLARRSAWGRSGVDLFPLFAPVEGVAELLPVLAGAFFLWWKGPLRRWLGQARKVVVERTATAMIEIERRRELDGLAAGVAELCGALPDLPFVPVPAVPCRAPDYRAALGRYLRLRPADAVLRPAGLSRLLEAVTELARQDLAALGSSLAVYQRLACRLEAVREAAATLRLPLLEARAEDLGGQMQRLRLLALERRRREAEALAASIESAAEVLRAEIDRPASTSPPAVLAPGVDPYRLLGIHADTPTVLVRKLRLRLAQIYHPDSAAMTPNGAKMAELNAAFDAVMRDRARARRPW